MRRIGVELNRNPGLTGIRETEKESGTSLVRLRYLTTLVKRFRVILFLDSGGDSDQSGIRVIEF